MAIGMAGFSVLVQNLPIWHLNLRVITDMVKNTQFQARDHFTLERPMVKG